MKKVVVIPDSFKGTLSSTKICEVVGAKVKEYFPDCEVVLIPVADGGEGSVECFLNALGGKKVYVKAKNPFFEDIDSFYGLIENGSTAVIEMSACAGLPLVEERKNPLKTTTYGVGQLILDAAAKGVKKIIVGLGGSSTNDGGCGAASAIGVKFYNNKGEDFIPVGETLCEIERIDMSSKIDIINGIEIVTMCDIDNPMYGPTGAAYVFAPQKGADHEMVKLLDEGIKCLSQKIKKDLNRDVSKVPGSGAAGAMGAGMMAFFGSKLQLGIETVLDTVNFNSVITDADMIFTGEGRIDCQSLRGKVVIGVAKRAQKYNVPLVVIAGGADYDIDEIYNFGVTSIFTINRLPEAFETIRYKSMENMEFAVENILRLIKRIKANK
ncbi:glycerate kinase [Pseudobacteroides cellulosolvens]|uniref:Glycerate kinase n=1 Tax=Pseudobacteroides cellulosolvens ATCC 35603 = DSM 2933 TaxID=398512 RepID=A0A0L6JKT7_9FIRM|nr:glycerate kinase [Pseudobacteroides cellulosolvens]KNY25997.1 glycerate kinase [Pseudobacteroides cellulosolvens ATCC 35603 = DSM 2933]